MALDQSFGVKDCWWTPFNLLERGARSLEMMATVFWRRAVHESRWYKNIQTAADCRRDSHTHLSALRILVFCTTTGHHAVANTVTRLLSFAHYGTP